MCKNPRHSPSLSHSRCHASAQCQLHAHALLLAVTETRRPRACTLTLTRPTSYRMLKTYTTKKEVKIQPRKNK